MGVVTYNVGITSPIPAAKLFKAFVLDGDTLIPKILPQAIKSVQVLEGNGGVGTIKLFTFGEGSKYKSAKQRVDEVDKDKYVFKYSIIEGDTFGDVVESISYVIKMEESGNGGSVCKNSTTYFTKGDAIIKEEDLKAEKDKAIAMHKALEAYLIANPDYN